MLPWGNSMRTDLTREAAETAAAIGKSKQTVIRSLAAASKDIASEAGNAAGLGGLMSGVGRFAMGHPLITAGAMAAGFTLKSYLDRQRLGEEVGRNAIMLGQGGRVNQSVNGRGS